MPNPMICPIILTIMTIKLGDTSSGANRAHQRDKTGVRRVKCDFLKKTWNKPHAESMPTFHSSDLFKMALHLFNLHPFKGKKFLFL